jgi:hypothetical protein
MTRALARAGIDRRLHPLRAEPPASRRREALQRDITRLINAYQEQRWHGIAASLTR